MDADGVVSYYCTPCGSRALRYVVTHVRSPQHRAALAHLNAARSSQANPNVQQHHISNEPPFVAPQHDHEPFQSFPMDLDQELSPQYHSNISDQQDIIELVSNTGRAFGGESEESDVEEIGFNSNAFFLEYLVQLVRQDEFLPGDTNNPGQQMFGRDSEWYPFKNAEVCLKKS